MEKGMNLWCATCGKKKFFVAKDMVRATRYGQEIVMGIFRCIKCDGPKLLTITEKQLEQKPN